MARVFAIHPAGTTPAIWSEVAALAPDLDLVAPDVNRLAAATGPCLPALVKALAGTAGEGEIVVTGCSLGANLAIEVAAAIGSRLKGLLLLTPLPLSPDEAYRQRVRGFAAMATSGWSAAAIESIVPLLLYRFNPRFERAAAVTREMLRVAGGPPAAPLTEIAASFPDAAATFASITAPIRVVFGGFNADPLVGEDWQPTWRRLVGDRAETIPDAAEFLPLEAPERIVELLRELAR